MSEAETAFGMIAVIGCLGACLVWAFYELEQLHQRSRSRAAMLREAFKHVKRG